MKIELDNKNTIELRQVISGSVIRECGKSKDDIYIVSSEYTTTGRRWVTSLVDGARISKEAYALVDILNVKLVWDEYNEWE